MVSWRGEERGGLDAKGATGMGIESRIVGRDHWRGIGRGRPDAISLARDLMRAWGASDAKRLQASELRSDAGQGPNAWALALPNIYTCGS
jgi:hypothetical protein